MKQIQYSSNEVANKELCTSNEKEKKYQSKRKKTMSRFLQDSTIAVYNPKQSFEEESSIVGDMPSNSKPKKTGKRGSSTLNENAIEQPKTKKRISIKEYLLKNNLLMEENLEERFCICRYPINLLKK